jgi:excisionase family DNA binding protein
MDATELVNVKALTQRHPTIPRSWFYSAAEAGRIPSYKVGRYRLFRLSEVEAWIQAQRQGPVVKAS